jgi:hypothetical protein
MRYVQNIKDAAVQWRRHVPGRLPPPMHHQLQLPLQKMPKPPHLTLLHRSQLRDRHHRKPVLNQKLVLRHQRKRNRRGRLIKTEIEIKPLPLQHNHEIPKELQLKNPLQTILPLRRLRRSHGAIKNKNQPQLPHHQLPTLPHTTRPYLQQEPRPTNRNQKNKVRIVPTPQHRQSHRMPTHDGQICSEQRTTVLNSPYLHERRRETLNHLQRRKDDP